MRFFIALLFSIFASTAHAQSVPTHWGNMNPGSYMVFNGSISGDVVWIYRGKSGGFHVVDVVLGKDPNAPHVLRSYRDDVGNVLRKEFADGKVETFAPHNCQRMIGDCRYTRTTAGKKDKFLHRLTPTKDGFKFSMYYLASGSSPALVGNGEVLKMDKMGITTRQSDAPPGMKVDKLRLKKAVYR